MAELTLAARWLRTVAEIAMRAVGPKRVCNTLRETMVQADLELVAGQYAVVGVGKCGGAHVSTWLDDGPQPADHRVFAPRGYAAQTGLNTVYGNHPIPGPESFRSGRALRQWLMQLPPGMPLVCFVSGGGSATVEDPRAGYTAAEVTQATEELLSQDVSIETINPIRAQWSALKAGGALHLAGDRTVHLVVQSDMPPGTERWISSGLFDPGPFAVDPAAPEIFAGLFPGRPWRTPGQFDDVNLAERWSGLRVLAGDNHTALQAAATVCRREELTVEVNPESLNGPAELVGRQLARAVADSDADVLLFGGEPTVTLPAQPGRGGRMGRLALAYGTADWASPPPPMLAAATDGVDGSSSGAGAFWLPGPFDRAAAQAALDEFDSDTFFRRTGRLFQVPPTGINVRDLVIVLRNPAAIQG